MVAAKAPKARHYSSSESLETRVGAAVAQKNVESTYLSSVFEKCQISPGKFYKKQATKKDQWKDKAEQKKLDIQEKEDVICKEKNNHTKFNGNKRRKDLRISH